MTMSVRITVHQQRGHGDAGLLAYPSSVASAMATRLWRGVSRGCGTGFSSFLVFAQRTWHSFVINCVARQETLECSK